jgi:hypothetical protein
MYWKNILLLSISLILFNADLLLANPQNSLFFDFTPLSVTTPESECISFHHSTDETEILCPVMGFASIEMSSISEIPIGFSVLRELGRDWYLVILPTNISTFKSVSHLGITQLLPAYSNQNGQILWLTDRVLVSPVDSEWIGSEESLISHLREPSSLPGVFVYRSSDPLSTANEWVLSGEVAWAQPDFIRTYQLRFNGTTSNRQRGFTGIPVIIN